MSNDQNAPVRGRAFKTFDGPDNDGVRAEVFVEVGHGPIVDLVPHASGKTAMVKFHPSNLKHAVPGWVPTDDPVFEELTRAYEAKDEVNYRIESQRKRTVDRSTPMEELRKDMSVAKDNINRIVASVNGITSREAVTNPKEDPKDNSGRHSALNMEEVNTPAAPVQDAPNRSSGNNRGFNPPGEREPAIYFQKFSDGVTPNYGSLEAKNIFLAEPFVRKHLAEQTGALPEPKMVAYYLRKILEMADYLQAVHVYRNSFPVDRMANSYMQVRYVIEGVINDTYPMPTEGAKFQEWYKNVGTEATVRLQTILSVLDGGEAPARNGQAGPAQRSAQGQTERPAPQERPQSAPERQETPAPAPAQSNGTEGQVSRPDALPGIQRGAGNLKRAETPRGRVQESNEAAEVSGGAKYTGAEGAYEDNALKSMVASPSAVSSESNGAGAVRIYTPQDISDFDQDDRCGDNEIAEAREFCVSRQIGAEIEGLLRHAFIGGKLDSVPAGDVSGFIRELPLSLFPDFMGFYEELDQDELKSAIRFAKAVNV